MRDTFVKTLLEEAKKDPNIVLITGDLGFGVLDNFQKELPNQFINTGVNEQAMMGMAAGIASTGKRVFVYSIGNFPTLRCIEQIRNDVCLMNNPVVIVSVGAGYAYGSQGYTHHALEDIAILRALPNMEVVVPADPLETAELTKFLVASEKPSYFRLGKSNEPKIHVQVPYIQRGQLLEITEGADGSILFCGSVGTIAMETHIELKKKNRNIGVYSVPFVSAIDPKTLRELSLKGPIVSLEEHSFRGGLGSAVLEVAAMNRIKIDFHMVASSQINLSQIGDQDFLRSENGIAKNSIVDFFL